MDLSQGPKLVPGAAAAALMVTPDQCYLLQHRDPLPGIFFPGFWGCFGGALEPGETPEQAMRRELQEELSYSPRTITEFATLGLDFRFAGLARIPRIFFEIPIEAEDVDTMVLAEGQDLALVPGREIMTKPMIIPYDATVIWQHLCQNRF